MAKVKTTKDGNNRSSYLAPVAACFAAYPAAMVTHLAWGGNGVMDAAVGAGAVVLTGVTHHTWKRRHEHTRLHATVFTGAVSGWVAVATSIGPYGSGMLNAWGFGSLFLCTSWVLRITGFAIPHENDRSAQADSGMGRIRKGVEALKGARVKSVTEEGDRVEAVVQLNNPRTVGDVQTERTRIASNARVGADQVTVTPVAGDESQVRMAFTRADQLAGQVRWAGPSQRGGSVADSPLVYGLRSDSRPAGLWVCGAHGTATSEPRSLGHMLCTGAPGSGKTETMRVITMLGRWREDFCAVVGDPDKFDQGWADIADTLSIAAVNKMQVRRLINNLPAAIAHRAQLLGNLERSDGGRGYKQWESECWTLHRIPLVMVDIEEAATVLNGDDEEFDRAVRTARSTGIWVVASLQSAHGSNIERKTRGLFTQALTHGCMEMYDAKFSLNANTIEAGANPMKWGADSPGSHYAEVFGTPRQEWAVDVRTFGGHGMDIRAELDASKKAGMWAELDPGTARVLGAGILYPDQKVEAVTGARVKTVKVDMPDQDDDTLAPDLLRETEEGTVDISQELERAPRIGNLPQSEPAPKRPSTEEARERLALKIEEMAAAGDFVITTDTIKEELVPYVGRSRTWFYPELERLAANGVLEPGRDRELYRIRTRLSAVNGSV